MKLVKDIIDLLSEDSGDLANALLKTKVLLHKIGAKDLVAWVNNELNGYSDSEVLPRYRVVLAQVLARVSDEFHLDPDCLLPIGHLSDGQRESLEQVRMRQSIASLQKLSSRETGSLVMRISPEAHGALSKSLAPGWHIERAWRQVQLPAVEQILVNVRSRLLDFVLEINEQFAGELSDAEMKARGESVNAHDMFHNSVFGDNTTFLIGSNNAATVSSTVVRGDLASLASALRANGVAEADIDDLKNAIDADGRQDPKPRQYGPEVKLWLKHMLAKAVDAAWQIEVGVASGLLATALQKFYGWP